MNLGDRMKLYEQAEAGRTLMPGLPVCIRLDGRAFHTYCHGLQRPFDSGFRDLMTAVTEALVHETNAEVGYTQSDEISLVLWGPNPAHQPYFGGRVQKICSSLAAVCSVTFNRLAAKHLPEAHARKIGLFDCHVWNVPSLDEAANVLLWRERDATKNSIAAAAQSAFSHARLYGCSGNQMQEMLWAEKGINWNNYPSAFKRGVYVTRRIVETPFTADDIAALPLKHAAHDNPHMAVRRATVAATDFGYPLGSIYNRVEVLFSGAAPIVQPEAAR